MSGNGQNNGGGGAAPQNPQPVANDGALPKKMGAGNFQNLPIKRGNGILIGIFTRKQ